MAKTEILYKLDNFISQYPPSIEESGVVYVMVCIRKILDHEDNHDSLLLRFYCDWVVHTQKDRITKEISTIMTQVYEAAVDEIRRPFNRKAMSPVTQFAYMEKLRLEMDAFFKDRNIEQSLTAAGWVDFISQLVKVLENQPIKNPIPEITAFQFLPAADRCVRGVIDFKQPVEGQPSYTFANAY